MAAVIAINPANPMFAGLNMKKVSIVIGAVSQPPMFYNFKRNNVGIVGDAGTNNKLLSVSVGWPLVFEDADFTLLGSQDPYHASRTLSLLIDFMRKSILTVTIDGVVQTPEQVLAYTFP
jgi:hypothetical protein